MIGVLSIVHVSDGCEFCSVGWQESLGIIMSVVVGFLYILNVNVLLVFSMVISR
jgi:hypothetical protein